LDSAIVVQLQLLLALKSLVTSADAEPHTI
jgi:hypothetical protein